MQLALLVDRCPVSHTYSVVLVVHKCKELHDSSGLPAPVRASQVHKLLQQLEKQQQQQQQSPQAVPQQQSWKQLNKQRARLELTRLPAELVVGSRYDRHAGIEGSGQPRSNWYTASRRGTPHTRASTCFTTPLILPAGTSQRLMV